MRDLIDKASQEVVWSNKKKKKKKKKLNKFFIYNLNY
jgi:hypothetical protein